MEADKLDRWGCRLCRRIERLDRALVGSRLSVAAVDNRETVDCRLLTVGRSIDRCGVVEEKGNPVVDSGAK